MQILQSGLQFSRGRPITITHSLSFLTFPFRKVIRAHSPPAPGSLAGDALRNGMWTGWRAFPRARGPSQASRPQATIGGRDAHRHRFADRRRGAQTLALGFRYPSVWSDGRPREVHIPAGSSLRLLRGVRRAGRASAGGVVEPSAERGSRIPPFNWTWTVVVPPLRSLIHRKSEPFRFRAAGKSRWSGQAVSGWVLPNQSQVGLPTKVPGSMSY